MHYSKTFFMVFKVRAMRRLLQFNITTIKMYFDTLYVEGLKR